MVWNLFGGNKNRGSGTGIDGRATTANEGKKSDGELIVMRKHPDWLENDIFFRWMQDSHEGGKRYRDAVYGADRRGMAVRNLFRHKREYPDPQRYPNVFEGYGGGTAAGENSGSMTATGPWPGMLGADPGATEGDDDYELRRSRTPVPEFTSECLDIHLGKIYEQEVTRDGPPELIAWWQDVDGCGTPIDDYMRETIAPGLFVNGVQDVAIDNPAIPEGEKVETRADELRLGLDSAIASVILPQNMVWWRKDAAKRYVECLVKEYVDPSDRKDVDDDGNPIDPDDNDGGADWRKDYVRWRHWTRDHWTLYSYAGDEVIDEGDNTFGFVPIVRLFDIKKQRTPNVGKSRYEYIANLQRAYYNLDSETVINNVLQSSPLLCIPEDFLKADNTISVGVGNAMPMKRLDGGAGYQGPAYIAPPRDPSDSLRADLQRLIDAKDRNACLTKPAGAAGTSANTVSQSGVSKEMDAETGGKLLTSMAKSLARAEKFLAEYALMVLKRRPLTKDERASIKVRYPVKFALRSAQELIDGTTKLQGVISNCGQAPNTERELIQQSVHQLLLGLEDKQYKVLDDEIDLVARTKSQLKEQDVEFAIGEQSTADAFAGDGSTELNAGSDPTGESGTTAVANTIPAVQ